MLIFRNERVTVYHMSVKKYLFSQMQNHISFLHEELIKLPAFPRKALDAEFSLYQGSLGNVSTTSKLHVI